MPRTPKLSQANSNGKPYVRSRGTPSPISARTDPSASDASNSPAPKKKKSIPDGKGKAWTVDEHMQLFERVAKAGMGKKTWEGAVDGRTPNQCYQAWIHVVAPFLKKALSEKARR